MERRLQLKQLAGMDPVTLHVTIADAVRRPIRQLEPATLLQLVAASEVAGLQDNTSKDLAGFVQRLEREMSDIPTGPLWTEFVGEIGEQSADSVPKSFREIFGAQIENRGDESDSDVQQMLQRWADAEPKEFVLGNAAPKLERTTRAAKPKAAADTSKPARATKSRASKAAEVDPERQRLLRDMCLERLSGYLDKGLAEKILLTGVTFSARKTYRNVTGPEVVKVLKTLEQEGIVKRVAGRWIMGTVW